MDKDTNSIISEQLDKLPVELKDAIFAVDYPTKLQTIVKNNRLLIDQAGKLETETTLVMLGLEPLGDYTNNLIKNLEVTKEKAATIANDVNELIFKNIRESLRKINDEAQEPPEKPVFKKPEPLPTREEILAGIENPETIKKESSASVNMITPNTPKAEVKIAASMLPEISPEPEEVVSMKSLLDAQAKKIYHQNISPVANIVESKMTETIAVPKETVVVEEKTKLPPMKSNADAYREPIE